MMNFKRFFILLAAALVLVTGCKRGIEIKTIEINQGWQFRQKGKEKWFKAIVPGCVHTDLMANGLLEDPFYRDNEKKAQWVEEEDWEYLTRFTVDKKLLKKENIEIVLYGLDTYAQVYLNDSPLLEADNMFREWRAEVKPLLKLGENTLRIHFRSPVKKVQPRWEQLGYELPEGPQVMTRKAPYHYGWDWGPRLVTCGTWRPVVLKAWNRARIQSLQIVQQALEPGNARLTAELEIEANASAVGQTAKISILEQDKTLAHTTLQLKPGTNRVALEFEIKNPRLWWTNGLGEPHLYHLKARLKLGSRLLDEVSQAIGLRTVELVTEKDEKGESFYFKLNGVPLFIKGANYIPQDSFVTRVTDAQYKKLIPDARDANMNMLRVWGGGIYENDIFYDLCDQAGILVWQDFMFACGMYPGNDDFLKNVRQEAVDNVKRLRHHACIALWCGNNEVSEAWHNWGWQERFSSQQQEQIWSDYQKLFHDILPQVVKEYDNGRFYWPSSPRYGRGNERSQYEGDSHYWGVWHDGEPFDVFKKKIPRFMSEFGFQSFPRMETIERFTRIGDHDIDSEVMKVHQKHPRGLELIKTYMARDYPVPIKLEHFLYISRLLQAEGMRTGIEAHRRAKPYCMGTLYWQMNDCWPAVSWSGIDYYGNWKALHYFVGKAYEDVLVSPVEEDGKLKVYIVSDKLQSLEGLLVMKLMDFSGKTLWEQAEVCRIDANSSRSCFEIEVKELLEGKDRGSVVFSAEFRQSEKIIAANLYYFVSPKELRLLEPDIKINIISGDEEWEGVTKGGFEISSDTLVKNVYLSIYDIDRPRPLMHFSDNYFDLLPGETRVICFSSDRLVKNFGMKLGMVSLRDVSQTVSR
ncbi:MAG: glycoside hydrolase family 2 protein [Candidatus Aminicenantes bacterium]|nr:glycoside hydrolase family 2 protein [Candidatus Aminicenantes bacterium]NIM78994.1 glycoside hydrolase family 2 protein [Candidatus Aminicenantes bacterium]NIN18252.1 glycoside hydrolase family 2 protein [Candidatus Aminicenantes bacterium]NIN42149.1 glycoside hydrolase family 2 protein [Candidatus Aminicenantes bacterium]NIN84905.1 glycoside hydrolase family 2 protein [Candidatus Aminicenantes bacterium]